MRRTLAGGYGRPFLLLVGLGLMAGTVEAQNPTVSQTRSQRTISSTKTTVGDTTVLTYVTQDSFRTRVVSRLKAADSVLLASLRAQNKALQDSIAKLLAGSPPPPPPPADTTPTPPPPPPVDTTPPAPGGNKLFSSDWAGGLLDGGKWTRWGGQSVLSTVPAAGLGFPAGMANVLRVSMGTGSFDWVQVNAKWSLPAVGESRAYRIYYLNAQTATGGWSSTHPIEGKGTDGSFSGNVYHWNIGGAGGQIAMGTPADYPRNWISTSNTTGADVGTLPKTVHRLEWKWTRTGTATYSLDIRISNAAGTVVESNATMRAWGGNTLASNNTGFPVDAASITGFRVGINGGQGGGPVYWGGFAVCTDWCGAYSAP